MHSFILAVALFACLSVSAVLGSKKRPNVVGAAAS